MHCVLIDIVCIDLLCDFRQKKGSRKQINADKLIKSAYKLPTSRKGDAINYRIRLTVPRIQSFNCPVGKSQISLWDTASPCLAVRATPTRKTSIFESRFDGKTIRTTIGDVANLTIEEASKEQLRQRTSSIKVSIPDLRRRDGLKARQPSARRGNTKT